MTLFKLRILKHINIWLQVVLVFFAYHAAGQNLLNKAISITAKQTKISAVLNQISERGAFTFPTMEG